MGNWGEELHNLWVGREGEFKRIPLTKTQGMANTFLRDLVTRQINYPTLKVPGMTGYQQTGMNILGNYLQGPSAGYNTGLAQLMKTVQGGYDPATSPEYAAFRDNQAMEQDATVNALRRSQELRGISAGTPALKQEGQLMRGFANDRNSFLASIMNRERDRQLNTAPVLMQMEQQEPLNRIQAAETYGAIPRQIESEQDRAIYEALVQTMLAPYQLQAGIANNLLNQSMYMYQNPQQPLMMQGMASFMPGHNPQMQPSQNTPQNNNTYQYDNSNRYSGSPYERNFNEGFNQENYGNNGYDW